MPEDKQVEDVEEVTPEPAEATPPPAEPITEAVRDNMAELMLEFAEAGKQEPHELAIAVQRRADQIAQNRVKEMLDQRQQAWEITQLAAHYTGGAKYGLPVTVIELTNFMESLNPEQFRVATALFEKITNSGLVEFQEIGHGRRLLKQPLPAEYHDSLARTLAAGNSAAEFFELAGLGDPGQYDLSQFEGGK